MKPLVFILFSLLLMSGYSINAKLWQVDSQGVVLFYITRSSDADTIMYEANLNQKGKLNVDKPVKVYWLRVKENCKKEPITRLQKKFSYGLNYIDTIKPHHINCYIAAYPDKTFTIQKKEKDIYRAYAIIKNQEVELMNLFIKLNGGSFFMPVVEYIKITGVNENGKVLSEYLIP